MLSSLCKTSSNVGPSQTCIHAEDGKEKPQNLLLAIMKPKKSWSCSKPSYFSFPSYAHPCDFPPCLSCCRQPAGCAEGPVFSFKTCWETRLQKPCLPTGSTRACLSAQDWKLFAKKWKDTVPHQNNRAVCHCTLYPMYCQVFCQTIWNNP